jgi:hypothetical protein
MIIDVKDANCKCHQLFPESHWSLELNVDKPLSKAQHQSKLLFSTSVATVELKLELGLSRQLVLSSFEIHK